MDHPDVLAWRDGQIEALDQTALPHLVRTLRISTVDQLVRAITSLAIRGAPVLGAAGALGVALAVRQGRTEGWDRLHDIATLGQVDHDAGQPGAECPGDELHSVDRRSSRAALSRVVDGIHCTH